MAEMIIIKPSSGDSSASLFSGPDSSDTFLASVPAGTIMKVISSTGKFYTVEYDNGVENVTNGGTGMTGTIVAYPYTAMYNDTSKSKILGNINNGTSCEIIDDSNKNIISVKAVTTEGTLVGFVDAKFIYRDIVEERPVMFKTLRTTDKSDDSNAPIGTGKVITKVDPLNVRSGPDQYKYPALEKLPPGSSVNIYETRGGWHRIGDNKWVNAKYILVNNSNPSAIVSKSDAQEIKGTSDGDDWTSKNLYINYDDIFSYDSSGNPIANDDYYRQLADKYAYALGAPPKYNMDIDIQYTDEITPGIGRVMNKTIMSNPAILSICPGTAKMFPNLIGAERDSVVDAMIGVANGNNSLINKINSNESDASRFSGRLYKFEAATSEYAKYVNALCRACAIMLNIGDELMPDTTSKLKNFDYAYWTIRKKYDPWTAEANDSFNGENDTSLFRTFWPGLIKTGKRLVTSAVDDTTYINFFLNGAEASVDESIVTDVSDSPLASTFEGISQAGTVLNYFTGSGFDITDDNVKEALDAVYQDAGSTLEGLANIASNFMQGGRVILPKMISGARYDKSVTCNMKFVSPYGDKYSIFLKCIVPVCHALALALPKQLSDNMYTYPFLVRSAQIGEFAIDLGVVSDIKISRGGSDNTSWTTDSIATEWEVDLTITPLVNDLVMTSTSHPLLMVKNEHLLNYLSNFCGFDALAYNLDTKYEMMTAFVQNIMSDIPSRIENRISDSLYNKVNQFFTAL